MGAAARTVDPHFHTVHPGAYDGQFYWGIAIDPLATGDVHRSFDNASYRYGHPLLRLARLALQRRPGARCAGGARGRRPRSPFRSPPRSLRASVSRAAAQGLGGALRRAQPGSALRRGARARGAAGSRAPARRGLTRIPPRTAPAHAGVPHVAPTREGAARPRHGCARGLGVSAGAGRGRPTALAWPRGGARPSGGSTRASTSGPGSRPATAALGSPLAGWRRALLDAGVYVGDRDNGLGGGSDRHRPGMILVVRPSRCWRCAVRSCGAPPAAIRSSCDLGVVRRAAPSCCLPRSGEGARSR